MNKDFFFDIDGTLLSCDYNITSIPESVRSALDELKANGDNVYLATGRCPCFLLDGVLDYDFNGLVSCNGALVIKNNKIIYSKKISKKAIEAVHDFCVKYQCCYYFEDAQKIYILNTTNPIHQQFVEIWGMKPDTLDTSYHPEKITAYIGMIIVPNEKVALEMRKELSKYFNIQQHMHGLSFDLTLKGESKAKGILELIKYENNTIENTIAFGDGRNDIEMISTVGLGIAMGNAADELKEVADDVTDNVEKDGIVKALVKHHFIKE